MIVASIILPILKLVQLLHFREKKNNCDFENSSSSGSSIVLRRKRARAKPLLTSSESETKDEDEWSERDKTPEFQPFIGLVGVNVITDQASVNDVINLLIGEDCRNGAEESNRYYK